MRANFGSRLDHIFDEMCQMNTRIGRIARWQSRLGGFAPCPSPEPTEESFDGGDDKSNDASSSEYNAEMTPFPWFTLCHLRQKGGVILVMRE